MKRFFIISLSLLLLNGAAFAQDQKNPAAYLIKGDGAVRGFIIAANKKNIRYKEKLNAVNHKDVKTSQATVYFLEPNEFKEAMLLYRNRKYKEAREAFAKCAFIYKKVNEIKGNHSTLSRFYEMECARKMEDLPSLAKLMGSFIKDPLLNKDHLLQIEINKIFWGAVQNKAWPRLLSIANDPKWYERVLPGNLRAQIEYCTGLAYEGTEKPIKALTAYNRAFTADFGASETISRKSASSCLRILKNQEAAKTAMDLWGTEDFNPNSDGAFYLKEGNALVKLWEKSLGVGHPLPADYVVFKKYGDQK